MKMSEAQFNRLAGLGAFAMGAGLIAAYALFFWFISPRGVGIDRIEATVAQIAVGMIFLALIAVHFVFGRILLNEARLKSAS